MGDEGYDLLREALEETQQRLLVDVLPDFKYMETLHPKYQPQDKKSALTGAPRLELAAAEESFTVTIEGAVSQVHDSGSSVEKVEMMPLKNVINPPMSSRRHEHFLLNAIEPMELPPENRVLEHLTHVLLLVGEKSAGKTSLIDTITNYICDVKYDDAHRYSLKSDEETGSSSQTESQSKGVTVHLMTNEEIKLGIIDTPGFGEPYEFIDIKGKVEHLLDTQMTYPTMKAVGFVIKGSTNRLGVHKMIIFNEVLKLFPEEAVKSTFACFTHCSECMPPIDATEAFPFSRKFAFENSQIMLGTSCADISTVNNESMKTFYGLNMKTCENMFRAMENTSVDSKGIPINIKNGYEAGIIRASIFQSLVKTGQEVVDLYSAKQLSEEGEARNAGTACDVHCRECNTKCCSHCIYPGVDRCDKMKVSDTKIAKEYPSIVGAYSLAVTGVSGITASAVGVALTMAAVAFPVVLAGSAAAFGASLFYLTLLNIFEITLKNLDIYECKDCKHGPQDHEFKNTESNMPSSRDVSEKNDSTLETKKNEIVRIASKLRTVLEIIKKEDLTREKITAESFVNAIFDAVKKKCPEDALALQNYEIVLNESMREVFGLPYGSDIL